MRWIIRLPWIGSSERALAVVVGATRGCAILASKVLGGPLLAGYGVLVAMGGRRSGRDESVLGGLQGQAAPGNGIAGISRKNSRRVDRA